MNHMGLEFDEKLIGEMAEQYSFKNLAKKAKSNHYRKGVAGDWVNHFTPEISEAFNRVYGDACDLLNYSKA